MISSSQLLKELIGKGEVGENIKPIGGFREGVTFGDDFLNRVI